MGKITWKTKEEIEAEISKPKPPTETELLQKRLAQAEQDNLTALEALAEVYEQLLMLQEQVYGGV